MADGGGKPRLLHLNADASWILTIPLSGGREVNLAIDPWLQGDQVDFFGGFSRQWHGKTEPLVERLDKLPMHIDAVICTHHFSDHCHHQTLDQLPPDTPVVCGTSQAYKRVQGFDHFRHVLAAPYYREGHPSSSTFAPLPPDLSFVYLPTRKFGDLAQLHGALVVMWERSEGESRAAIVLSPHGVPPDVVAAWRREVLDVEVLALLHSLDIVTNPWWLGGVIAFGHPSALRLCETLKAKDLVSHHDEDDKRAQGLVSVVLKRTKANHTAVAAELKKRRLDTELRIVAVGETLVLS